MVEPSLGHVGDQRARSARRGAAALDGQIATGADIAAWRPTTRATPMSADQAVEIARLRQENERRRVERDIV